MLIAWAFTSGGGGGSKDDGKPGGSDPVESITPGPSSSGPAISEQPGGRDESGEDGGSEGSGGSGGDGKSSGGAGGDGASSDGASTGSGGTGSAGTGGGGAGGQQVPANSSLPDCKPNAVRLSLRTKVSYAPEDKPKFELVVKNTSSATCKTDLGPKNVVLTVTEAGGDENADAVWSSKDCPARPGPLFLKVPAGATVVHTVDWNRVRSAPDCATPPPGKASPGTYLLEAESDGGTVQPASFVLAKD
ncbi:hypothetical protein [Streptomyces sp. NPDC049916]|uniref:hypothetical protein n=1 Tax=Streptomyces sp. NPDC049916 TaxID=3155156 RepID=UPI003443A807